MPLVALLLAVLAAAGDFEPPEALALEELERRYRIDVVETGEPFPVANPHGAITGAEAPAEARASYAVLLGQELGLYPPAFVKRTRLRRIVLCRDLAFDGQLRAAIPDFGHATLYLDVLRGAEDAHYVRRTIHHEFFHVVDWQDDGALYADAAWSKRNPDGFQYGSGGAHAQDASHMSLWTERSPGFLSAYAQSGVEEDKAELWSFLLVHPREVAARAQEDELLSAKVAALRTLAVKFSPSADGTFWDGIARLERPAPRRAPEGD
jgi:hypothetical protein